MCVCGIDCVYIYTNINTNHSCTYKNIAEEEEEEEIPKWVIEGMNATQNNTITICLHFFAFEPSHYLSHQNNHHVSSWRQQQQIFHHYRSNTLTTGFQGKLGRGTLTLLVDGQTDTTFLIASRSLT
mmetsp:Transcript_27134/g.40631  ORF Transcript_27134/g.40631 Transcript_27134/m.40631 type:complete len:126 (+) Transcript_27134:178-555(+)